MAMAAANDDQQPTLLLSRLSQGDASAAAELLPLLYDELRSLAGRQFRGQPNGHTLQPTVLVHEAFLRLLGRPSAEWKDRRHFFAVAATAMRQVLVNHARAKNADKRGGGDRPVPLEDTRVAVDGADLDVLDIDDALAKLAQIDPRKHRLVELRFFAGLTVPEVADVMELSVSTVEAEWRVARAWLSAELSR